jgi:hypothetical protein
VREEDELTSGGEGTMRHRSQDRVAGVGGADRQREDQGGPARPHGGRCHCRHQRY